jgi:hypothetical protein
VFCNTQVYTILEELSDLKWVIIQLFNNFHQRTTQAMDLFVIFPRLS